MRHARFWSHWLGSGLLLSGASFAAAGCTTEAACFQDCKDQAPIATGGTAGSGGNGIGGGIMIGVGGDDDPGTGNKPGAGGGGMLEDAGTECDTVDLQNDIDNCGVCGEHCVITGAESKCVKGKCEIEACRPNRYDQNGEAADGCELACDGDPMGDEVCNGDDDNCNGTKDEGFDLQTDVENCGVCGNACDLQHASSKCEAGVCKIDECEAGFSTVDDLDSTGCEYPCHIKDKNGVDCDPATADVADGCGVEICDTYDQDCDGDTSQVADAGLGCTDFCGTPDCVGECSAGTTQCVGTVLVCVPGDTPAPEICDNLDNNCDGVGDADEFRFDTNPLHCGNCETSCVGMFPHAIAKCVAGQCQLDVCETDYGDYDANAPGCELCPVRPVRTESCNGKDDDCDGAVDDNVLGKPAVGGGYCKQKANTLCNNVPLHCDSNVGGWVCEYPTGVETIAGKVAITESLCDGIDGNCDGQSDEAFLDLGKPCDDGAFGVCLDFGEIGCHPTDPTKTACNADLPPDPPMASAETCNGLDDNCDGVVDEGTDQLVHIKRGAFDFYIDKYEASRPDATASSAGTDESHLCGIPNRLPWTGASFDEAKGACLASGKRLCHITELEEACAGTGNRTYPYGNVYVGASCNGIDAAGSAAAPTGSFTNCVTADGVFDLSGNVSEWSDKKVDETTGNPKYDIMALQGGSFLTPFNGLTCKFDLDVITTNAVLPSLGFRCCKDGP
jgi:hypothetical protein